MAGPNANSGQQGDTRGVPRSRPWLLPSNRKLRHLQGLSLRNLQLERPQYPLRGKTIDDESLPHTLKTPAKALAQREIAKLEHSKSSDDLKQKSRAVPEPSFDINRDATRSAKDETLRKNRIRRRSTLDWAFFTPKDRQQRLDEIVRTRLADCWFSLHVKGFDEPVYVSEVIEKTMNPTFAFFDLNAYGAYLTRQEELLIKFWTRTEGSSNFSLLVELNVNLRALQYIGKTLETFRHPLPQNAVLFHLSDGIYTSFTDLPTDDLLPYTLTGLKPTQHVQPTSSFDALMQLSNLDNCIQDALSTREKLTQQINKVLNDQSDSREAVDSAARADASLAATKRTLSVCRKQLQAAHRRRSQLQERLAARKAAIQAGQETRVKAQKGLADSRAELTSQRQDISSKNNQLTGQIRRIGEDLSSLYDIAPVTDGSLAFTIRGLHLPFAGSLSEKDETVTSAALGHAAHITYLLSFYLSTPLPYPITLRGSSSTIFDPISLSMPSEAARTFPLYQKGAVTYRFEYGVFLLNTNIELLMSRRGARMVDLRYTLGNLKYILTVITEGRGEVPGRKRGQIKALNGNLRGSSRSSSVLSGHGEKSPLRRVFDAGELKRAFDGSRTQ